MVEEVVAYGGSTVVNNNACARLNRIGRILYWRIKNLRNWAL